MQLRPRIAGGRPRLWVYADRGFTLVELIVTIALLSILVALASPSFSQWIRSAQVRTVADATSTMFWNTEMPAVESAMAPSVTRFVPR